MNYTIMEWCCLKWNQFLLEFGRLLGAVQMEKRMPLRLMRQAFFDLAGG